MAPSLSIYEQSPYFHSDDKRWLSPQTTQSFQLTALNEPDSELVPSNQPRPTRFWLRGLALLLAPPIVTAYFIFIWRYLLEREQNGLIKIGLNGEVWVFYSWFVVSVLALEWSRYGLMGVGRAMLETDMFRVPHMVGLLDHSERTWSGPEGWWRSFSRSLKSKNNPAERQGWKGTILRVLGSLREYKLWYILSFLRLCLHVGLPLSGFTMELSEGWYVTGEEAPVNSRTPENFHQRSASLYVNSVEAAWSTGSPASVPGFGVVYTQEGFDRNSFDELLELPNTVPVFAGAPDHYIESFITSQSISPVSGEAWGLRVGYQCMHARNASELILLSRAPSSLSCDSDEDNYECLTQHTTVSNDDNLNLWAYVETAIRMKNSNGFQTYDGEELAAFDSGDRESGDIFEMVVWQVRRGGSGEFYEQDPQTSAIVDGIRSPFVKDDDAPWAVNATFLEERSDDLEIQDAMARALNSTETESLIVAKPIGISCRAISTTGTAVLDPGPATFRFFQPIPPAAFDPDTTEIPLPRIGKVTSQVLQDKYLEIFMAEIPWSLESRSDSIEASLFLSSELLEITALRAYGLEASQVMYNSSGWIATSDHSELLKACRKVTLVSPGKIPPLVSIVPLTIWMAGSVLLACIYAFRLRGSEFLDGLHFLRAGALSGDRIASLSQFTSAIEAHQVKALWEISGSLDLKTHGTAATR